MGEFASIHRYPNTGHWFAEPSKEAYREDAANIAYDRTLDFLKSPAQVIRGRVARC